MEVDPAIVPGAIGDLIEPRRPQPAAPPPKPARLGDFTKYGRAVLEGVERDVSTAPAGGAGETSRRYRIYGGSARLASLIECGAVPDTNVVEATMLGAAHANGYVRKYGEADALQAIRGGIEKGLANPVTPAELERRPSPGPVLDGPADVADGPVLRLSDVLETFRRWLYLPDARVVYATLGAFAANRLDGDPVWLLIVGASGYGKTETIQSVAGQPDVHSASTLTTAALLSGTPKRDKAKEAKGGLLREIGDFGIILCKDFTSILSMHREARAEVIGALREVYDGSYIRHLGTDGGRALAWSGRVGFIGGVTPTIDRHAAVMSVMGERFLLFRVPEVNRKELTRKALRHTRGASKMRAELADAVGRLFEGIDWTAEPPELDDAESEQIVDLANFVATARSPVERDGYKREIELIGGAEAPTRIALTLARLLGGLRTIGTPDADAWSTMQKCALDCVPATRLDVLRVLEDGKDWSTRDLADKVGYPTGTARRTLEDLAAYKLVERDDFGGSVGDKWRKTHVFDLAVCFPEMSQEVNA
jgi:hypothetical protein